MFKKRIVSAIATGILALFVLPGVSLAADVQPASPTPSQGINLSALGLMPGQTTIKNYNFTNGPTVKLTIHRLTPSEVTSYNKKAANMTAASMLTNSQNSYSICNEDSWGMWWMDTETYFNYDGSKVTDVSQDVTNYGCTIPYSITQPTTSYEGINTYSAHATTSCSIKEAEIYQFSPCTTSNLYGDGYYSGSVSDGDGQVSYF